MSTLRCSKEAVVDSGLQSGRVRASVRVVVAEAHDRSFFALLVGKGRIGAVHVGHDGPGVGTRKAARLSRVDFLRTRSGVGIEMEFVERMWRFGADRRSHGWIGLARDGEVGEIGRRRLGMLCYAVLRARGAKG